MIEFWNKRYAEKDYAYGEEPNVFFENTIYSINEVGTALFPAEGEGRNAVYAAKLGWKAYAFDTSEQAKIKALQLAEKENVTLSYSVDSFNSYESNLQFDLIVLCYTHVPASDRTAYFRKCIKYLKTNGTLILEGFSKNQLGLNSGGPKNEEMLFSKEDLKNDFSELKISFLEERETYLNEGKYHKGKAKVIQMIATRI